MKPHIRFSLLYKFCFPSVLGNSRAYSNPVLAITITTTPTYNPTQEDCFITPAAPSPLRFPALSLHDPNAGHQTLAHVLDLRSSDPTIRDYAQPEERSDTANAATTITAAVEFILPPALTAASPGDPQKWHLTTYWSCVTDYDVTTATHCGWHEPVLPGGDEISGAPGQGCEAGGRIMVILVAAVAVALLGIVLL